MPLLNYTTQVDTNKTIMEIQKNLAQHGASAILTDFDNNGYIVALSFKIKVGEQDIGFKLPTDWRPIFKILNDDYAVPTKLKTEEQAIRVGWRIVKDWVEAQMALLESEMVTMQQIFLPYAVTADGSTIYEKFEKDKKLLLGSG